MVWTHRRKKRDTTYVVSLFLKQETVLRTLSSSVAEGEFISPEHCNQKGGAALRAAKPKKKDTPGRVLLFGDPAEIRTPDTLLKRQVLCRLSYWVI